MSKTNHKRGYSHMKVYKSIRKEIPKPTIRYNGKSRKAERKAVKDKLRGYRDQDEYI